MCWIRHLNPYDEIIVLLQQPQPQQTMHYLRLCRRTPTKVRAFYAFFILGPDFIVFVKSVLGAGAVRRTRT